MMANPLDEAKARLMARSPYFGQIAATLKPAASEDLPTFRAEGGVLRYNPSWLTELEGTELETVLAHAALQKVLWHENRGRGRHGKLWRLATEYAVNALLAENDFELPLEARYDPHYRGMYAEEIYARLMEERPPEEAEESDEVRERDEAQESDEAPDSPEGERSGAPAGEAKARQQPTEGEAMEAAFLEQVALTAEREGALPKGLERLAPRYFRRRIDWRERLGRYLERYLRSGYSFTPPNLKHLYRGIALPRPASETLHIAITLDCSGSVDRELLELFAGEVEMILQHFPDYRLELMMADARVRSHRTLTPGEPLEWEAQGRGHTDFRPVFDYLENEMHEKPGLLIYFTDGAGTFPEAEPPYEVLWVLSREAEVPFGEAIVMES
jgi:predicted metal-dependent peptidase